MEHYLKPESKFPTYETQTYKFRVGDCLLLENLLRFTNTPQIYFTSFCNIDFIISCFSFICVWRQKLKIVYQYFFHLSIYFIHILGVLSQSCLINR